MKAIDYEKCLNWAEGNGLDMDSRIERKQVNGVYGMYAKAAIPKGSVLTSIPQDRLIPIREDINYPEHLPDALKRLHSSAIEIEKGAESDYEGCVSALEDYDALQAHSFYFFSEEELRFIEALNPVLFQLVMQAKFAAKGLKQQIRSIDPSLSEEVLTQVALNSFSRSWGNSGFIPVLDLFNHSDKKGLTLKMLVNNKIGHVSGVDYQAGEQIFVSYSRKDMINQTILFNYFDPNDIHFIDYSARAVQVASTPFQRKLFNLVASQYRMQQQEGNGVRHYRLLPQNLFFTDEGSSLKLLEYFQLSSIQTEQELQMRRATKASILNNILSSIDALLHVNNVADIKQSEVPEKLQHFYAMQVKERGMLLENRAWVLNQRASMAA